MWKHTYKCSNITWHINKFSHHPSVIWDTTYIFLLYKGTSPLRHMVECNKTWLCSMANVENSVDINVAWLLHAVACCRMPCCMKIQPAKCQYHQRFAAPIFAINYSININFGAAYDANRRCHEKTSYVSNYAFFTLLHKWVDRGQTRCLEKLQ